MTQNSEQICDEPTWPRKYSDIHCTSEELSWPVTDIHCTSEELSWPLTYIEPVIKRRATFKASTPNMTYSSMYDFVSTYYEEQHRTGHIHRCTTLCLLTMKNSTEHDIFINVRLRIEHGFITLQCCFFINSTDVITFCLAFSLQLKQYHYLSTVIE